MEDIVTSGPFSCTKTLIFRFNLFCWYMSLKKFKMIECSYLRNLLLDSYTYKFVLIIIMNGYTMR